MAAGSEALLIRFSLPGPLHAAWQSRWLDSGAQKQPFANDSFSAVSSLLHDMGHQKLPFVLQGADRPVFGAQLPFPNRDNC